MCGSKPSSCLTENTFNLFEMIWTCVGQLRSLEASSRELHINRIFSTGCLVKIQMFSYKPQHLSQESGSQKLTSCFKKEKTNSTNPNFIWSAHTSLQKEVAFHRSTKSNFSRHVSPRISHKLPDEASEGNFRDQHFRRLARLQVPNFGVYARPPWTGFLGHTGHARFFFLADRRRVHRVAFKTFPSSKASQQLWRVLLYDPQLFWFLQPREPEQTVPYNRRCLGLPTVPSRTHLCHHNGQLVSSCHPPGRAATKLGRKCHTWASPNCWLISFNRIMHQNTFAA